MWPPLCSGRFVRVLVVSCCSWKTVWFWSCVLQTLEIISYLLLVLWRLLWKAAVVSAAVLQSRMEKVRTAESYCSESFLYDRSFQFPHGFCKSWHMEFAGFGCFWMTKDVMRWAWVSSRRLPPILSPAGLKPVRNTGQKHENNNQVDKYHQNVISTCLTLAHYEYN